MGDTPQTVMTTRAPAVLKTHGVDKLRQEIRSYTIFIQPTAIILNTANSTILAVCTKGTNYITNGG